MNRFQFHFFNFAQYRSEDITIVGTHYDDARTSAWTILAEQEHDRNVRAAWRLVSTIQAPLETVGQ